MEVILVNDYPALGYVGDKVKVRGGFGRNFLLPRGMAIEASLRNQKLMKHKLSAVIAKKTKLKATATEIQENMQKLVLEFKVKVGESGKSYGAITVRDIETQLKEKGFIVDRKQIKLIDQIKGAGEYEVEIKLHSEVSARIPVKVTAEAAPKREAGREEKRAPRRGRKAQAETEEGASEAQAGEEEKQAKTTEESDT